jgi:hypothetical protein
MILLADGPRYFMTDSWLTNTDGPAMKKAGTRQRSTCSCAYHFTRWSASKTALSNLGMPTGRLIEQGKKADNDKKRLPFFLQFI